MQAVQAHLPRTSSKQFHLAGMLYKYVSGARLSPTLYRIENRAFLFYFGKGLEESLARLECTSFLSYPSMSWIGWKGWGEG